MSERPIVYLDTETTSLRADRQAWEFAWIRRESDGRQTQGQFFMNVDLATAEPMSLAIGGYYRRHPHGQKLVGLKVSDDRPFSPSEAGAAIARVTHEATLVGAQVQFDTHTMEAILAAEGLIPSWHYRLREIESISAGYLQRDDLGGLAGCAVALEIHVDPAGVHTAAGDALVVMDIWDKIFPRRGTS